MLTTRSATAVSLLLALMPISPVTAQPAQAVAAAARDEGERLKAAGKLDEACARFAASYAADPQPDIGRVVDECASSPPPQPPPIGGAVDNPIGIPPPRFVIDDRRRTRRRIVAASSAGVGLVATAVGLYFGRQAFVEWDASRGSGGCDEENVCNSEGQAHVDRADRAALTADVLVGVGVAGLVTGAVLWFTAPDAVRRAEPGGLTFTPVPADGGAVGTLCGSF